MTSAVALPKNSWLIEPPNVAPLARVSEMWRQRGLLRFFVQEALMRFYRNTTLGWTWLILRPLMPVAVHILFFGFVLRIHVTEPPFIIYYVTGMTLWHSFDQAFTWATRSIDLNRKVLSKVYFPRMLLPIAFLAPSGIDFCVLACLTVICAIGMWLGTGVFYLVFGVQMLWIFPIMLLALFFAIGLAFWLAPWAATARDVIYTQRYVMSAWFLLTPVAYPRQLFGGSVEWVSVVNPMVGVITQFRNALIGAPVDPQALIPALIVASVVFVTGFLHFAASDAKWIDKV